MGLAASQARFLCLTARKADCEYKTTELAQEKLNITNQLTQISNDYANAMNATKLMWSNEGVSADYGLSYGVLMAPSALNDYNAYMVTTKSGAIVLNSQYAAAAKAAGISRNGGFGSQDQRDKFISALGGNIVTSDTAKEITKKDYSINTDGEWNAVIGPTGTDWNPYAGMGDIPMDKVNGGEFTLADLILSDAIGQQKIDWGSFSLVDSSNQITSTKYDSTMNNYNELKSNILYQTMTDKIINQLKSDRANQALALKNEEKTEDEVNSKLKDLDTLILQAQLIQAKAIGIADGNLPQELQALLKDAEGKTQAAVDYLNSNNNTIWSKIKERIYTDAENFEKQYKEKITLTFGKNNVTDYVTSVYYKKDGQYVRATGDELKKFYEVKEIDGKKQLVLNSDALNGDEYLAIADADSKTFTNANSLSMGTQGKLALIQNGIICTNSGDIKDFTIGDILATDIVLYQDADDNKNKENAENINLFIAKTWSLFETIIEKFGYSKSYDMSGTGLNVDDASKEALEFAYNMTRRMFSRVNDSAASDGKSPSSCQVYKNAIDFNMTTTKAGTENRVAVSLTNMLSSFLTYYDNSLRGGASEYVVGRSTEQSVYVTDNPDYCYIAGNIYDTDYTEPTATEKNADFFDQLYNNILAHGWRQDDSVDDSEYLEALIKDGRYSLASLSDDGYYYQSRYNETGYIIEVSDTDAIARAEAEFTAKKAELTYKEDSIDLKTKNLDTEISSLNQELESVKKLISGGIEKAFQLFQQ